MIDKKKRNLWVAYQYNQSAIWKDRNKMATMDMAGSLRNVY